MVMRVGVPLGQQRLNPRFNIQCLVKEGIFFRRETTFSQIVNPKISSILKFCTMVLSRPFVVTMWVMVCMCMSVHVVFVCFQKLDYCLLNGCRCALTHVRMVIALHLVTHIGSTCWFGFSSYRNILDWLSHFDINKKDLEITSYVSKWAL